jgi:abhydrolase domain-containing protein 17
MYLPYSQGSSKILIYFHGNAEDIGLATELLDYVRSLLRVHVLAVEYPGYGIYDGTPDAAQIQIDADYVYFYLTQVQKIPQSSIILFGRSIGTGPASYLASRNEPCALLLMSPFTSIRDIVKEAAGKYLSYAICDRFRNIDVINSVKCPTFIVHG